MKKTAERLLYLRLCVGLLFMLFPLRGMSNDTPPVFDRAEWESLAADHDYSDEKVPEPEEEENAEPPGEIEEDLGPTWFDRNFNQVSTVVLSIVVILLLTLIVYLIVRHMNERDIAVGRADLSDYSLEQLDATANESDLERFLREALERKEYRAAVRIYYLLALNRLNERGLIRWERDKTNRSYLNELSDAGLRNRFGDLTLTYEVMWYGEAPIDEAVFGTLQPEFANFIKHLNNG
ncbi:MAG: DUF4129 domain-containing protein [Flavobacteriales bacterium]